MTTKIDQIVPDGQRGVMTRNGALFLTWAVGVRVVVELTDADAFTLEDLAPEPPAPTQEELDKAEALQQLALTDTYQFKVVDFLLDVLISKGVVTAKELPDEVAQLYAQRKAYLAKLAPQDVIPAVAASVADAQVAGKEAAAP